MIYISWTNQKSVLYSSGKQNFIFVTMKIFQKTMQGQGRYNVRISFWGGVKVGQKQPFLAFFQTIFCDKNFLVQDIHTKLLKCVKD